MPNYRRARVPGASYFFTVNLADRASRLLIEHIELLRSAFRETRSELPFRIEAIVILPDHVHCIWTLPPGDADFSIRWQRIKTRFSRSIVRRESLSPSRAAKGERGIWQRRFWEHLIRDEADHEAHVHYIHYNPVKHGHVERVAAWPYSSFHGFVRKGIYPADWGSGAGSGGRFGERD